MAKKLDKKNDGLFPFQTYTFRNTTEMETMCPSAFDMMLNPEHEHELWIGNINGLVSPTSEYGLAIKLKGYIIAGKKLTFILPENYTAIRPDNGNIGFRKSVLDMIRLGESRKQITIFTYSIEHAEEDINKILKDFKETDMKFDVAIMNPPYDKNLHLKILEAVIPIADKVVNISPIRWLQDPLAKYKKNSDYKKFEESISKKIESLDVISAKNANGLFSAIFGTDLGIYTCCNTTSNCINADLTDNITKRVVQHMIQNHATFDYNKKDGVRIRIPCICGGKSGGSGERNKVRLCEVRNCLGQPFVFTDGLLNGKQWHEYYRKNQYSKTTDGITCSIKFNSTTEADNFFASVNTQFYKYIHHNVVLDVHIEECKILFMQDYTQPWDDKRFCEYFNITGYIDDEHAEPGSEWEIILNKLKEYV